MYQTCYYHLIVYGEIVETDYYISDDILEEYQISKKILKRYKNEIKENGIEDCKIEIFHSQKYKENISDILDILNTEIEIIKEDINNSNKYKKSVFDFSNLKNILDCL